MEHEQDPQNNKEGTKAGGLFIPAGIFIGMGIGLVMNNLPAGLFIGMGAGFAAFAIVVLMNR